MVISGVKDVLTNITVAKILQYVHVTLCIKLTRARCQLYLNKAEKRGCFTPLKTEIK